MLVHPDKRSSWSKLFAFAGGCLRQPGSRGGRRHNLTSAVVGNIRDFSASIGDIFTVVNNSVTLNGRSKKSQVSIDVSTARRAASRLDEGDVKGAIRQLCSTDKLATPSLSTHRSLLSKHPVAPSDRRTPSSDAFNPITVTADQVLVAIRSFPPGSSGGLDGLRPQHLKDMVERQVGNTLIESLTAFINLILSGNTPEWVRSFLFGASLLAFTKKDGGVRPIAVGLTLRRLAAKVACRSVTEKCALFLKPRQLGVGVKGGGEALVHGTRRFLDSLPAGHVFVKLDFSNAFNSVRRDVVRDEVLAQVPELLGYFDSAYGASSTLSFGEFTINSAEGVQQGDPLGPLLFCLAIHPLLCNIQSEFISGYLDDIGIGGAIKDVLADVQRLEMDAKARGLSLNHSKCEVIGLTTSNRQDWDVAGLSFTECALPDASLLGTPIQAGTGVDRALECKRKDLEVMVERLALLPAHSALFLLRNAFAIPKLLYLLRTAPCFDSTELAAYDVTLKASLASILNIELSSSSSVQAGLPLRWGGIGVRRATQLAPSAFLASAAGAADLLSLLLPNRVLSSPDPAFSRALVAWRNLGGVVPPGTPDAGFQRKWDEAVCQVAADRLMTGVDECTSARLLAARSIGSGAWLSAIPSASLGLHLDDSALRIAVGLRLGAPIVLEHQCSCGASVSKFGRHGLACKRSAGRHLRHNLLNDILLRALQSAGVPSVREPPGLARSDAKRPDGATLVPWSRGRCLLWDATCPDTLAPSYVQRSAIESGSAAALAESKKRAKYANLSVAHEFVPVAIETLGSWGQAGLAFVNEVGRRISAVTGDKRATSFLKQRLAMAIQRGNAAAVLGTLPTVLSDCDC